MGWAAQGTTSDARSLWHTQRSDTRIGSSISRETVSKMGRVSTSPAMAVSIYNGTSSQVLTAFRQYILLRTEYNSQTITSFSQLYRKINRCSISNHKPLKEYCDDFIKTRNKFQQLGHVIKSLHSVCAFLDGLDESYQGWKDQLFSYYISNLTNAVTGIGQTTTVMNVPVI